MAVTDGDHQPPPQVPKGIPFLVISDVNTGCISFENARFVSQTYYDNLPFIRKAIQGDILFTVTGSYGIVIPIETNRAFCFQRHIGLIKTILCSQWLTFVLQSQYVKHHCDNIATGTAQKTVSLGNLRVLYIPIPPLSEQNRIVGEINNWFVLIDNINKNKEDLYKVVKQAKSKILSLAISGKLVTQDPNDEPAIELLKRINPNFIPCDTSHYPQLPQGWQVAPMHMLCNLVDGDKQNGIERINLDVKYLRGKGESVTLLAGKYVPANSTMILVDGENSGEIFTTPIEGYQGSTFKLLNISNEIYKPFILYVIKSHQTKFRENKVGSAIPHLNKKLFKEIDVLVPPFEEQKRMVQQIDEIFASLDTIALEL